MVKLHLQEKPRGLSFSQMKCTLSHQKKSSRTTLGVLILIVPLAILYSQIPERWHLPCILYQWSGIPCPTCGTTRCATLILHGSLQDAFNQQPLAFCALLLLGLGLLYHILTQIAHLPALRIHLETRKERLFIGLGLLLLITANWIYLLMNN